ncbi:glycerol-3-phosphate 1-O-acyltransferase PlsY [Vibrio sp. SS-MA-C1-2]|uniref:glycerol-3-phosphate 1-O-acyltransferase PlsY n=1 Tax=Vibrio sp. SS-MA-C1-2 TaxID=2908646 RepID=UPI001F324AC8|nr:glycerol-3-phosphate 1-O-acyltransferase PlsY [Vibrio sp. SS-MA-C1-2]UJF19118.1 glycerol-3-phosphate 1-O-acyltransferase PlsY [Vibrio sp. SS-MA-C1-2]
MTPLALVVIIAAYLLGSISSAVLICRLFKLPDPRDNGSKNPGATNVLRLGGKMPAASVLVCDLLKGLIPVWGGYFLHLNPFILGIIGIAATLGHIYPIFFHFRGGKGVATAFGSLAPIGWDLSGLLLLSWGLIALVSGFSSLAAIGTAILAPLFTWFFKPQYTMPVAMLACIILWRHQDNIRRLWDGLEDKILHKKSDKK